MPRLVFCPTAFRVASTASLMRCPTASPVSPNDGRGGFGARHEVIDGHVVARGQAMHVAGLQRVELG